jgi:hypothetical protein
VAVDGQVGRDDLGEFFVVDDRVARGQLGRDERREDRVAADRAADFDPLEQAAGVPVGAEVMGVDERGVAGVAAG